MKSITFPEATNKIAEHQEEFNTVHSQWNPDDKSINLCFEVSDFDLAEINRTKKIWYKQQTFGSPMMPIMISPFKDHIIADRKEMMGLNDIDTSTPEGKMLFASLAMLTTTEDHKDMTPDEALRMVTDLKNNLKF